jgi:hypothetical protein
MVAECPFLPLGVPQSCSTFYESRKKPAHKRVSLLRCLSWFVLDGACAYFRLSDPPISRWGLSGQDNLAVTGSFSHRQGVNHELSPRIPLL